jgi:tRNA(His) 5'-end guanylyltransferase
MKDELGDRMKANYEDRTRYMLPRRTYTLIRLDGKAFHTYTKELKKPFDADLSEDIDGAIIAMLPHIQGAVFAYTQSDEISILVTDFSQPTTTAWFDGNIQKICSVSASYMTAEFNRLRARRWRKDFEASMFMSKHGMDEEADSYNDITPFTTAIFDSRVFTIPNRIEVMNYFIWRNNDCSRNSVSMVAQDTFTHKELQGKSTKTMLEMLKNANRPWEDFRFADRYGRLIVKEHYVAPVSVPDKANFKVNSQLADRSRWIPQAAWKFVEDTDKLLNMIPKYE